MIAERIIARKKMKMELTYLKKRKKRKIQAM
jgi:hypothetical protein